MSENYAQSACIAKQGRFGMSPSNAFTSRKLIPLEGYRGIAAIIVMVHHFFLGFSPMTTLSLRGAWFFAFFNGKGAVYFFFTLSGFVLSWSFFHKKEIDSIFIAFFKRLPRLSGPVTIVSILSFFLFKLNFYWFHDAGQLSGSKWLASFANSDWTAEFHPRFFKALSQGIMTFFSGEFTYNSNIWTMQAEFAGSLFVFLLCPFVVFTLEGRLVIPAFLIFSVYFFYSNILMLPFAFGAFLSYFLAAKRPHVHLAIALILFSGSLYLLGYVAPEKDYVWLSFLPNFALNPIFLNTVGSTLLIFCTMCSPHLFVTFENKFFEFLGRQSFSLYLVHTLVICSVSSYTFLTLDGLGVSRALALSANFLVTACLSFSLAWPLSKFDEAWVRLINTLFNKRIAG
jgi:peptidoglycan/LPS O-acetylase OafA/YrhL